MEIKEVLKKLGFEALSDMQKAVGRAIRETGKDVVVLSPTGSGKTLAYLLPVSERIRVDDDRVQAVVLVPEESWLSSRLRFSKTWEQVFGQWLFMAVSPRWMNTVCCVRRSRRWSLLRLDA